MQTYKIKVPQHVSIEVIQAALAALDVQVTAPKAKPVKADRVYQEPVIVYKDGEPVREIDGIEVEQRIRKFMSSLNTRMWSDGRKAGDFPQYATSTEQYVTGFCNGQHHVKTKYELNGSLIEA